MSGERKEVTIYLHPSEQRIDPTAKNVKVLDGD